MFYTRYQSLCRMRGVTPSGGADEMNLNRATVTFWKKESFSPRQSTLEKLSAYFGVPISYLNGEESACCPLCGGSGIDHTAWHRRFEQAAERFGFCWNMTLRQKALAHAREELHPAGPRNRQQELWNDLAKAHFSHSLELCNYATEHCSFPAYRRRLLEQFAWEEYLSPEVLHYWQHQPTPPDTASLYRMPESPFCLYREAEPSGTSHPAAAEPIRLTGVIPLLGRIAAGAPILAEEHIEEYLPTALPHPEEYFALRVKGDSMIGAGIQNGDTVTIHKQETARHGQIVACLVNGEEATLKRFTVSEGTVLLLPENSRYQPIVVRPGDFETGKAKILGVAIEVSHRLS